MKKQAKLEASLKYYKRKAAYHEKHYKIVVEMYDELEREFFKYKDDPKNYKELFEEEQKKYRKTLEDLVEARKEIVEMMEGIDLVPSPKGRVMFINTSP